MNNWYEELVKECEATHDKECEHGEECPERTSHIERVFVRHALKDRVVTLQARLAAVEKLHWQWGNALDSDMCPSCSIVGGCDHTEGYHHAWEELGKAVRRD